MGKGSRSSTGQLKYENCMQCASVQSFQKRIHLFICFSFVFLCSFLVSLAFSALLFCLARSREHNQTPGLMCSTRSQ